MLVEGRLIFVVTWERLWARVLQTHTGSSCQSLPIPKAANVDSLALGHDWIPCPANYAITRDWGRDDQKWVWLHPSRSA